MRFKSLGAELFFWVLLPLAIVAVIGAWFRLNEARTTATLVQERMLLGSARIIAEQIHYQDGAIVVQIPPAALELFQAEGNLDHVYYRVTAPDGQLLSGYYEMPVPIRKLLPEEHVSFSATMRDEMIRIVGFAQPVIGAEDDRPVIIEVGQTNRSRDSLIQQIWMRAILQQGFLLALVAILIWWGLRHGLTTVLDLRAQMLRRAPGALEPLATDQVPGELKPLVMALNDYVERLNSHLSAQSRFIADASHQLRTPLSVLNMQVTYALRSEDPAMKEEALLGLRDSIQSTTRLANQLLTFSEAEAGENPTFEKSIIDLHHAAQTVVESVAMLADRKQIDLGFESAAAPAWVRTNEHLLQRLIANLVENAIHYTPAHGEVTVSIRIADNGAAMLGVEDNGPGIPAAERERVFERFFRLSGRDLDGCGLGLAIVREIAHGSDATVELLTGASGTGLFVKVTFPPIDLAREQIADETTLAQKTTLGAISRADDGTN
jgi:two-component system, OmpR family, sensor histidine kinase TctE